MNRSLAAVSTWLVLAPLLAVGRISAAASPPEDAPILRLPLEVLAKLRKVAVRVHEFRGPETVTRDDHWIA